MGDEISFLHRKVCSATVEDAVILGILLHSYHWRYYLTVTHDGRTGLRASASSIKSLIRSIPRGSFPFKWTGKFSRRQCGYYIQRLRNSRISFAPNIHKKNIALYIVASPAFTPPPPLQQNVSEIFDVNLYFLIFSRILEFILSVYADALIRLRNTGPIRTVRKF